MQRVKIWDSFVRLNHWLLVVLLVAMWWTADNDYMEWHLRIAPVLGALVLVRIVWGLFGSESARFSRFLKGPRAVASHVRELRQGQVTPHNTHNPAGGWAVVVLLGLLLAQFVSGLFAADGFFYQGPLASSIGLDLAEQITDVHSWIFDLLVIAVALHIIAIALYRWRGIKLVGAMVHGYQYQVQAPKLVNGLLAIALAAVAAYALFQWIH